MSPPAKSDAMSEVLRVQNLCVSYGQHTLFQDVALSVRQGETLVVVGESGCGKTTLLRAIAGLIPVQSGGIQIRGQDVRGLPPQSRGTVYLDQEPLLFEHLSVAENIGFAPHLRSESSEQIAAEVNELLTAIDLVTHAHKKDTQLSGGQKQRVAFARAILAHPQVLLLDEPFGSLDGRTRQQMQRLFRDLSRRYALTSVFVTHDIREALVVGDSFGRMANGVLSVSPSRQTFIEDPASGVASEVRFWLNVESPEPSE